MTRPNPPKELPTKFDELICLWKVEEPRIASLAALGRAPSPTQPDNTNYAPDLRLCVIVSSMDEKSVDLASGLVTTLGFGFSDVSVVTHIFLSAITVKPGAKRWAFVKTKYDSASRINENGSNDIDHLQISP